MGRYHFYLSMEDIGSENVDNLYNWCLKMKLISISKILLNRGEELC